jgi:uncharacterized membrane protein YeiH
MTDQDRQLLFLAVATAIGGGYIVKVALDDILGPVQPAYAREFEEAHMRAAGVTPIAPDALTETLNFVVAMAATSWLFVQGSDWALKQAGR